MEQVIVDTNLVIDYFRTNTGYLADLFKKQQKGQVELFLSTVSVFEIFSGQSSRQDADKIEVLLSNIKMITFSANISRLAGEIHRDINFEHGPVDLFIAATALSVGASLATKNLKHFSKIPKLKLFKF